MLHESNKFKYDQIIINKLGTTFNKSLITNYFIDSSVGLLIIKDMDMVLIIGKMEIDMKGIGMPE